MFRLLAEILFIIIYIYIFFFFKFIVDNGDQGSSEVTATEKALLLALTLKWMTESEGFKVEQTREYEKKIWLSHIQSAIEQEEEKEDSVSFGIHSS